MVMLSRPNSEISQTRPRTGVQSLVWLLCCLGSVYAAEPARPIPLVGYSELRTNLPGGRHANVRTTRAMVVNVDGTQRRSVAAELADGPDVSTQFAGWSPDGTLAVIGRGWQSPENAQWEEEHKTFRHVKEGYLLDTYLVDLATSKAENVTAVERISFYNSGVFFWPNDPTKNWSIRMPTTFRA